MQDPLLRQQTASEPLTLEQEYAMCASWEKDEDSRQGLTLSPVLIIIIPQNPLL